MANTYKVLGQANPSATTLTTLYTVPSSTEAVVSTITVANLGASAATYRIAVRPDGATIANQHYVAYDVTVAANDTTTITLGITVNASDIISVYASTSTMAFNAFGSEIA
jgi:hypothetical protein